MFEQIQNAVDSIDKFNNSQPYIDVVIVALVVLSAEIAKKYRPDNARLSVKWLTVFVGVGVIGLYMLALDKAQQLFSINFPKYVISFVGATVTYDYVILEVRHWWRKIRGNQKQDTVNTETE